MLAEFVLKTDRPHQADPRDVLIDTVLVAYYEDHVIKKTHNPRSSRHGLVLWQEFFAGRYVADLTPNEQFRFHEWLAKSGRVPSSIDKVLSSGRAALLHAVKYQRLQSAPHIFSVETREQKRARPPLGRPITPAEIARLIDEAKHTHLLWYLVVAICTLARPKAILELKGKQYSAGEQLVYLNMPSRVQTKKRRPTLPAVPLLQKWLSTVAPDAPVVQLRGKKLGAIGMAFGRAAKRAGLQGQVSPYSIRHGMAREMRRRKVPLDQIGYFLGHIEGGSPSWASGLQTGMTTETSNTTTIYAPMEWSLCKEAINAIEAIVAEIAGLLTVHSIDDPTYEIDRPIPHIGRKHLSEKSSQALKARFLEDVPINAKRLAVEFGISEIAVRKRAKKWGITLNSKRASHVPLILKQRNVADKSVGSA